MQRTSIEWVRNPDGSVPGFSWSPITGCLNNCSYCYARKLANGRLKEKYLSNKYTAPLPKGSYSVYGSHVLTYHDPVNDPFYPRFWSDRLDELRQRAKNLIEQGLDKPRGIFVCSMSDLFGIGIPLEWTEAILNAMDNKHDRFYILTKQPQNLIKFSPFPDNCFVGFTATTNEQLQYGLAHIANVEARIKYISFEPLLEKVSFLAVEMVDWVIIGGQSGTDRFHPPEEWIQEIEDACDEYGIPVFEKNNLRPSGALRQESPDDILGGV